jgi:hypothetical protein
MRQITGVGIAGVAGGVSYVLSLGFTLVPGTESFRFYATAAAIAGIAVGSTFARHASRFGPWKTSACIVLVLAVGCLAALYYKLLLNFGATQGFWLLVKLTGLLIIAFFCFGVLISLAGVSISADRNANH